MQKILLKIVFILSFFICAAANAHSYYHIKVYLKDQTVKVFKDDKLIKKMPCSTGIKPGSTPTGYFETYNRKKENVWVAEDGTAIKYYYKTEFDGHIGFHSQIEGKHPLVTKGKKLFAARKPSSMGCVRLKKQDAKFIYNLPLGVHVDVIDGSQ